MPRYRYFSLVGATESRRDHDHDISIPKLLNLINMYSAASDMAPTLRNDLTPDESDLIAVSDDIDGGPAIDDFLNYAFQLANGETIYFSSLVPYIISGGSAVVKSSTYNDGGTVTGTIGLQVIDGTNTAWLQNVWPGCQITTDGYTYYINQVLSNTRITIGGTLQSSPSGATYSILQSHNNLTAQWKIKSQFWLNSVIYQPIRMDGISKSQISGPFQNAQAALDYTWALNATGSYSWKFYGGQYWFRRSGGSLYYSNDPGAGWSSATGIAANVIDIYPGVVNELPCYLAIFFSSANVYYSTSLTGSTWVNSSNPAPLSPLLHIASNGVKIVAIRGTGSSGNIYSIEDLIGGSWVDEYSGTLPQNDLIYDGLRFVLIGDAPGPVVWTSQDGSTWDKESLSGTKITTCESVASNGLITVIVGDGGAIYSGLSGWSDVSTPLPNLNHVSWNGTYFFACGDGFALGTVAIYYSDNGDSWFPIQTLPAAGSLLYVYASDGSAANVLTNDTTNLYWGTLQEVDFVDFYPISNRIRSICFTVAGSYIVLGGVSKWNGKTGEWVHYPRRFEWPSPNTINWFGDQYEGAGFLDAPGKAAILSIETVNDSIVVIESDGLGLLRPTGDLNSPWGYRKYHVGPRAISSPLVLNQQVWYISENGKLYQANEAGARQAGDFDLDRYIDFVGGVSKVYIPLWLDYSSEYQSIVAFRSLDTLMYLISIEAGSVSKFEIPRAGELELITDGAYGMFSFITNDRSFLYINYTPKSDSSKTASSYYTTGDVIEGVDVVDIYEYLWHGVIHTGENRLSPEGVRVKTDEIEFKTYATGPVGVTYESRGECVNPLNIKEWQRVGDSTGSIQLTTISCIGTGTRWSYKVADGDDVTVLFTLQVSASICRVYRDSTLLVAGTDYTVGPSYNQITLSTPLLSGEELFSYFDSYPVIAKDGDVILDSNNDFHNVLSVDYYNEMSLDSYPSSIQGGTHYSVFTMASGDDGKLPIGLNAQSNELEIRIYIIPRGYSIAKIFGYLVVYDQLDKETRYKTPGPGGD